MIEALIDAALPDAHELPAFRCEFAAGRSSDLMVLIPVIDEGERILAQLARIRESRLGLDVLLVDGGSSDGSTEALRLQSLGVSALLVKTGPGRLSAQLRLGMACAMSRGYAGVITIDGNGKDDCSGIPAFASALRAGYDHLQGSRYMPGGIAENTPLDRELAVRFLHAPLINAAARFRYTDTTNGFRGYSRRLLLDPRVAPFRDVFSRYELHYYLAIRAARLGLRVLELPVTRAYPPRGRTPTKISPLRGNLLVLKTLLQACLHRFDPPATDAPGAA